MRITVLNLIEFMKQWGEVYEYLDNFYRPGHITRNFMRSWDRISVGEGGETMSTRNHVIITGTGRSGTTFLIELFTHLGLETGFSAEDIEFESKKFKKSRAGLEHDIRHIDCPYIVKHPKFCHYAEEVLCRDDIIIEHVFIPIRDLYSAAESRRYVRGCPKNIKIL